VSRCGAPADFGQRQPGMKLGRDEPLEDGGLGVKRLSELTGKRDPPVSRTFEVPSRDLSSVIQSLAHRLGWRFFTPSAYTDQQSMIGEAWHRC
jgi:hypothetical protein